MDFMVLNWKTERIWEGYKGGKSFWRGADQSRVGYGEMFLRKKGKEIKETWMKVKLVERKNCWK